MRTRACVGLFGGAALGVFAFGPGCNYDWTYVDPDGGAGGVDASANQDATPDPVIDPKPKVDAGNPIGEPCIDSRTCPPDAYCRFTDGACGLKGKAGTCEPSTKCEPGTNPNACACATGEKAPDACEAAKVLRSDVDVSGTTCKPPPTFACSGSPVECKPGVEYCSYGGGADGKCVPVPKECEGLGCKCATWGATCVCSENGGGVSLKCP